MANKTTTTQQFNVWNYVKKELCKKYLETNSTDFEVSFRIMDDYTNKEGKTYEGAGKVLYVLKRDGGIQATEVTEREYVTEDGSIKKEYLVKVIGFNPKAQAKSKTGKTYGLYTTAMQKALYSQYINAQ